jgi:hypothetical protein
MGRNGMAKDKGEGINENDNEIGERRYRVWMDLLQLNARHLIILMDIFL